MMPAAVSARLTDTESVAVQAPPLVVVCAWCPGFNPRDPRNQGVSHGICLPCRLKIEASLA